MTLDILEPHENMSKKGQLILINGAFTGSVTAVLPP
jgi:hypothetical protein